MTIYERIKQLREAKGLSQADLAASLKIANQNYWKIEKGKTELTVNRLEQIAEALGVSVVELLTGEPEKVNDSEEVAILKEKILVLERDKKNQQTVINLYETLKPVMDLLEQFKSVEHDPSKVEDLLNKEADTFLENEQDDDSLITALKPSVLAWIYRMTKKKL